MVKCEILVTVEHELLGTVSLPAVPRVGEFIFFDDVGNGWQVTEVNYKVGSDIITLFVREDK